MPRLPETHHRNIETRKAFQVKKNSAAIAPTWNRPIKIAVTQLISSSAAAFLSKTCRSMAMCFSCTRIELPRLKLSGWDKAACKTSVIADVQEVTEVLAR